MMKSPEKVLSLYQKICVEKNVSTQQCIMEQLKAFARKSTELLSFRGYSLTLDSCAVLGELLNADNFTALDFSDCVLTDDGAKLIINGLINNKTVHTLNLKGNNLRSASAEALGRLLRHNQAIENLILEWNSLGMWDASFSVLAHGIAANRCLKRVDLRSNQVSHDGATELSVAVKQNHSLDHLDLRWNNVGVIGARSLLSVLPFNNTLMELELCGNNIPDDLMKAIENGMKRNADSKTLKEDYESKAQVLTKEVRHLQAEKDCQMKELVGQVEKTESRYKKECADYAHKIGRLQETIVQRKTQLAQSVAKLRLVEAELSISNQKIDEYQQLVERIQAESKDHANRLEEEMRLERADRSEYEQKLVRELAQSRAEMTAFDIKISDLGRKNDTLELQLRESQELQAKLQTEIKIKTVQLDEQLSIEKQKCRESVRNIEDSTEKEIFKLRHENEENVRKMQEKLMKIEQAKMLVEEELSRAKSQAMQDRVAFEDELTEARQRVRLEEEQKSRHVEDKLKLANKSKEDLQQYANQQTNLVNQLQSNVSSLTIENEALKRRQEELTQEIAAKAAEISVAVMKTKTEYANQIIRLESENSSYQELKEQNLQLDKRLQEKGKEIRSLNEQIESLQMQISRMQDDEKQRVSVLQSAIQNYVQTSAVNRR